MTLTAPFRNREFRRLFLGRVVTNAGDSLFYIAAMWLVFELTGSELFTGLAGFLALAPQGLQFLAGPVVDRVTTRRVLVVTQALQLGLVLVIPLADLSGQLSVWVLLLVLTALSILHQPGYLAESAAIPRVVERANLVAGNSLFAVAHQGIFAGFNVVGGVLVAAFGAVTMFWVDSLTFALAILIYSTLRIPPVLEGRVSDVDAEAEAELTVASLTDGGSVTYRTELGAGIEVVRGSIIAPMLVAPALVYLATGGVFAVLPAYAAEIGGPSVYGLLAGAIGGGLLVGAGLAGVLRTLPVGRLIVAGLALSSVSWLLGVAVDGLLPTVGLLLVAFVPIGAVSVLLVSMVQVLVPGHLLGRVIGLVMSTTSLAMPIGSLVGGGVAVATSPTLVLGAAGVTFAVCSLYVLAVPRLRRLPQVDHLPPLGVDGR
jgi:MFS family permease